MINERIQRLRQAMASKEIDALIIPSSDPHQSEYVCDHWKSRAYFSGFTGSAGYLIITKDQAALWTDSRYFIQAEMELANSEVQLHRQSIPHAPEHVAWLCALLPDRAVIGIESAMFSIDQFNYLEKHTASKQQEILFVDGIIDACWQERPERPKSRVYAHDIKFAGRSREEKLEELEAERKERKCDHILITSLDEIAWLLNLRGWDIEFTPVALSYFLWSGDEGRLYIDASRLESDLKEALRNAKVEVYPYESIELDLKALSMDQRIYVDKTKINMHLFAAIECDAFEGSSLLEMKMAQKNETEIQHIRQAMRKDGRALLRFFRWLEDHPGQSEYDLVGKIAEFRSMEADYVGESFGAIVGWKGNGAIVHYSPDPENSAKIEGEGMLLIDSGGQYQDGTTDITRSIYIGEPGQEEKESFTRVLKGNIALQTIKFPEGTSGMQLDTLARMYLWKDAKNYGHGTGHGVGFFLRVHEPPQGFATSPTTSRGLGGHQSNMLTSNEPGFYKENAYGIRIENLILSRPFSENEYGKFLEFEALTLFPISKKLIDMDLMTREEIDWLDAYHAKVWAELSPMLKEEEKVWLKAACAPLNEG